MLQQFSWLSAGINCCKFTIHLSALFFSTGFITSASLLLFIHIDCVQGLFHFVLGHLSLLILSTTSCSPNPASISAYFFPFLLLFPMTRDKVVGRNLVKFVVIQNKEFLDKRKQNSDASIVCETCNSQDFHCKVTMHLLLS